MTAPPKPPASADHAHDGGLRCGQCGHLHGVERSYQANDRMLHLLLVALCTQLGLEAYRKSKTSTRVYVVAPDDATLDRLEARLHELLPKLDAELLKVVEAFVREHTGLAISAPKTP
jgi:hypothetical protein